MKDRLLDHPGPSDSVPPFLTPSLTFRIAIYPDLPTKLPPHIRKQIENHGGWGTPVSQIQKFSLIGKDYLEMFGIELDNLPKDVRPISRGVRDRDGNRIVRNQPEEVRVLSAQVVIKEYPVERGSEVLVKSKRIPIEFLVVGQLDPAYVCLGYKFINEHFQFDPTQVKKVSTVGGIKLEYTLKARQSSFCDVLVGS